MQQNCVIGIGGTGARVIEAILHCCAAGLGPERLSVLLVDPDDGNGNLARTTQLLTKYRTAQEGIRGRVPGMRAFATHVTFAEQPVWSIFNEPNQTLGDYVNYKTLQQSDRNLGDFISLLFSEHELSTPLNEGFRGHPSIGAVVMAGPNMEAEPWKSFWEGIHECRQNEGRVYLVGSIFGGTGAAGVPTFGASDMLKRAPAATIDPVRGTSKILLGAALVLPYFAVATDGARPEGELFVTSEDFPIATRAALQYYDEKELAFDEMYLIGDSLAPKVGPFSPGSRSQQNRAHYIELVTALAAFDFFRQPPPSDDAGRRIFAAGRENDQVDWQSLPVSRAQADISALHSELMSRLTTFTAFSYAMCGYGKDKLALPDEDKELKILSWYQNNFAAARNPAAQAHNLRHGAQADILTVVSEYSRRFLEWISEMDEANVHLVDRRKLWEVDLKTLMRWDQNQRAIGTFVKDKVGRLDFSSFVTKLGEVSLADKNMLPAERWVNLFYDAAYRFCSANYQMDRTMGGAR
jgi:hypothetical protein